MPLIEKHQLRSTAAVIRSKSTNYTKTNTRIFLLRYLSDKAQVNRYLLTVIRLKSTNYIKTNTLKFLLYYLIRHATFSRWFEYFDKSYLVALKAIQKMERHQVTVGNVTIPLAGSYKAELEERLLK